MRGQAANSSHPNSTACGATTEMESSLTRAKRSGWPPRFQHLVRWVAITTMIGQSTSLLQAGTRCQWSSRIREKENSLYVQDGDPEFQPWVLLFSISTTMAGWMSPSHS